MKLLTWEELEKLGFSMEVTGREATFYFNGRQVYIAPASRKFDRGAQEYFTRLVLGLREEDPELDRSCKELKLDNIAWWEKIDREYYKEEKLEGSSTGRS